MLKEKIIVHSGKTDGKKLYNHKCARFAFTREDYAPAPCAPKAAAKANETFF